MKKTFLLIALVIYSFSMTFAQKQVVGEPYSFTHKNISLNIDQVELPALDIAALHNEDAMHIAKDGTPLRVGTSAFVKLNTKNSGRTDILPNGDRLWRVSIKSPNALMLCAYISNFNIPEGSSFYIYSGDHQQLTGKYTQEDIQDQNGWLVSEDIIGDEITFEYYEPADALFHGSFEIDHISQIYRDIATLRTHDDQTKGNLGDAEGTCHPNVACPVADPWRDQVNSVVCIMIHSPSSGYDYFCSGALINNVRMDKTPYVLSAHHCIDNDLNCTFKFYFNYQSPTCQNEPALISPLLRSNGGVIVAHANLSSSSDFLLLKITGTLGVAFRDQIVFAGWDATGTCSVGSAIHHPGGDYKKISIPKQVSSLSNNSRYWKVNWITGTNNKGCTEQGSSGSPLFNSHGRIIGDLSNGSSACDYLSGSDNYGKLSHSWTNNNNSNNAKKLQPWLDPDNTGTLVMDGMHYDGSPAVGIKEFSAPVLNLNIAPNPSTGMVTVKGCFDGSKGICNVYNLMGSLVSQSNLTLEPSMTLNFSHLHSGTYFLEIISDHKIYKSKMVIAK